MQIIQTQRNQVIAREPQREDVFVRASFLGPADGEDIFKPRRLTPRHLRYEPVANYAALVEWAVGMADQMAFPIHIVSLNGNDILRTKCWEPFRAAIASMNDQEWGKLRQIVVTTAAEVMRDCDDPEIRADMFDIMARLKVIRA